MIRYTLMRKRLFLFDFDGVLFETALESLEICSLINNNILPHNYKKEFLKNRYLIGPAWNYKYLDIMIKEKKSKEWYFDKINSVEKDDYMSFTKNFFQTRKNLKDMNYSYWLNIQKPYPFLMNLIETNIFQSQDMIIISTKDRESINDLLNHHISEIKNKKIYGKDELSEYDNKYELSKHIFEKSDYDECLFVDDCLDHLKCFGNKIKKFHAGWGYNDPGAKGLSEQQLIKIINSSLVQ